MKPYACYNRPPFKTSAIAQDGWYMDGVTRCPRLVTVKHVMTTECQYSRDPMGYGQRDERCAGCKWRAHAAD